MQKIYENFFEICDLFEKIVQEQTWKKENKVEFKNIIECEYNFWKRVLSLMPPEKRLITAFKWFTECYTQIQKNLVNEPINWKIRWLQDEK